MIAVPTTETELWKLCAQQKTHIMWTLYESPYDYPGLWVARFFICEPGAKKPTPTKWVEKHQFRDEVCANIPYNEKHRWKFVPIFDPMHPQIAGHFI